jgi:hypothetical protein
MNSKRGNVPKFDMVPSFTSCNVNMNSDDVHDMRDAGEGTGCVIRKRCDAHYLIAIRVTHCPIRLSDRGSKLVRMTIGRAARAT